MHQTYKLVCFPYMCALYKQVQKSFHQMKGDVGTKSLHSKVIVQSRVTVKPLNLNDVGREKVGPPKGGVAMLPTTPTGLGNGSGC